METYIGSGLCFPISGRSEVGMTLTLNIADLLSIIENQFDTTSGIATIMVLPIKPQNVTSKKTHSVKITDVKPY